MTVSFRTYVERWGMEQWPFLWRLGWGCVLVLPYAAPALAQTSPCDFVNFAFFFFLYFFWFKGALCRAAVHSDVYLLWLFVWGLIKDCSCATQGPWSECLVWPRVMYPSKGDHTQVMRRQVVNWSVACTFSPFTTDKWDNIRRSEVK